MNLRIRSLSALMLVAAAAAAHAAPVRSVPLDAGTYVMADPGATCESVPNAGTLYLVGGNLIFPHDHKVRSAVTAVSRDGSEYTLHSTFTAYKGDDTYKAARTDVIKVADRTSFSFLDGKTKAPGAAFHRCGPAPKLV